MVVTKVLGTNQNVKIIAVILIFFFFSLDALAEGGLEKSFLELISKSSSSLKTCKPVKHDLLLEQSELRKYRNGYVTNKDIELGGLTHNPLDLSVIANDYESTKYLLTKGIKKSHEIVVWIVRYADISILKMALEKGLDPNISSEGMQSGLTEAAMSGLIKEAKLLVKHGANVNYKLGNGAYSLDYSIACGHKKLSQYLIDIGAKMSDKSISLAKKLGLNI